MAYFLRQDKKKKGVYLQMYESYWSKEKKQTKTRCVESFGYVDNLISVDIPNPVQYYTEYVEKKNAERKILSNEESRPRAFKKNIEKNVGYFLLSSIMEKLQVKETIDILAENRRFQFSIYDMICQLIYARVISPCSKSKTVSKVFPILYKSSDFSEDQVYDGCFFIGESYKKYIELFNYCYSKFYKRDFDKVYFDCTNYYFEIDMPKNDQQKGPSKENRRDPIIGQALLLDADLVPVAMQMYPGNESEKPYIRKLIDEMKSRYKIAGKTIQVADKGLNCAYNIYTAIQENDGYIFSKSIHGTGLSEQEKQWILLENDKNVYTYIKNNKGELLYKIKSCVDVFKYSFEETDPNTNEKKETTFYAKEKRVVSYNPCLAKKQCAEIEKMIEKAMNYSSYKSYSQDEIGESAKYLKIVSTDENGKKVKPTIQLNQKKIDEDLKLAGYNLLVTSETTMHSEEIYNTYHQLWKIEESFRITKTFLEARPVYVQKKETIYGHFLICYLSLFLLRILEIKCFKNKISTYDIIGFIQDFRVVDKGDGTFINISHEQALNEKIKNATQLRNLDALILTQNEIEKMFSIMLLNRN